MSQQGPSNNCSVKLYLLKNQTKENNSSNRFDRVA